MEEERIFFAKINMRKERKLFLDIDFRPKSAQNSLFFGVFGGFCGIFVSHETHTQTWFVPRETYHFTPFSPLLHNLFSGILPFCV